jgi:uncharacterized membrane protein YcaP (DUF421 family)
MEIFKNEYLNIIFSSVVVYLFIVIAIRLFGKKELSQLSIIDLVFILLISNAVQNAMVGSNTSLPGGLVAASALFIVNYILKQVIFYFPKLGKAIQGKEILLVYKGKINEENMKKARFTLEELMEAIREHGVASIDKIDLAILEVDGNISVLSKEFSHRTMRKRKAHKSLLDQH